MSQRNMEVVRSYVDLSRDDEWDRLADLLSDDLIYRPVPETLRDGKIVQIEDFVHRDEALKAAVGE